MAKVFKKPVIWRGNSFENLKRFSDAAKRSAGFQLDLVQEGEEPLDWKPMPTIGAGVKEIRIWAEKGYRVIYIAKFIEAIYVLHAFEKKTQKTSKLDLELAQKRYRELINERD